MYTDIKTILFKLTGQAYMLSVNVLFIDFAGGRDEGLFLSQMWYWQGKVGEGKYFAKTYDDWYSEIRVKKKVIMRAAEKFKKMGILKKEVKKFAGSPTVHYMLNIDKAIELLGIFCHNESGKNGTLESAEMELSNVPKVNFPITKNTTKNTIKEVEDKPKKTVAKKTTDKPQQTEQEVPTTTDETFTELAGSSEFIWRMRHTSDAELNAKLTTWAFTEILSQLPAICTKHGKQYTDEQLQAWTKQQLTTDKVNVLKTTFSMYGEPLHSDTVKHLLNRANWQLRERGGLDIAAVAVKPQTKRNVNYETPFK